MVLGPHYWSKAALAIAIALTFLVPAKTYAESALIKTPTLSVSKRPQVISLKAYKPKDNPKAALLVWTYSGPILPTFSILQEEKTKSGTNKRSLKRLPKKKLIVITSSGVTKKFATIVSGLNPKSKYKITLSGEVVEKTKNAKIKTILKSRSVQFSLAKLKPYPNDGGLNPNNPSDPTNPSNPTPTPRLPIARRVVPEKFPEMPRSAIRHVTDTSVDRIPNYQDVATVEIFDSGNWSTVLRDVKLTPTDIVIIKPGVSILYDVVSDSTFKALVIQQGALIFSPNINTKLTVGTILLHDGLFEMKPSAAVRAEVIFNGKIDRVEDPGQFTIGLLAPSGLVDIQGVAPKTSYARLAARANVGSTSFTVDRDIDWKVGDSLILAGVTFKERLAGSSVVVMVSPANEFPIISAINGRVVTVSKPFGVMHEEGVANLSRNASFTAALDSDKGHMFFINEVVASVRGAYFDRLGRAKNDTFDDTKFDSATGKATHVGTNQRGRYILHAHHVHSPVTFEDNVLIGYSELRWSISIHSSHALVNRNIIVNPGGAGLVAENGFETGSWKNNAIFGNQGGGYVFHDYGQDDSQEGGMLPDGVTNRQDFGHEGSGFWLRSETVDLIGNVTEGSFREGGYKNYFFQPAAQIHEINQYTYPIYNGVTTPYQGLTFHKALQLINDASLPRGKFKDNSSFSYGADSSQECLALASKWGGGSGANPFVADNFTVRHGGYSLMYSGPQKIINSSLDGSGANPNYFCANNFAMDNTHPVVIENSSIINYQFAFKGNNNAMTLRNVYLNNRQAEVFVNTGIRGFTITLDNVKFGKSENRIVMQSLLGLTQPEFSGSTSKANLGIWGALSEAPQSRVVVTNYNQVAGDNFEVIFDSQGPDYLLANLGGVTNQQLKNGLGTTLTSSGVFGRSVNGYIPSSLTTKIGVVGGYAIPIRTTLPVYDLNGPVLRVSGAATTAKLEYLVNPSFVNPNRDFYRYEVSGGTAYTETVNIVPGFNKFTRNIPGFGPYTFLVSKE